MYIRSSPHTEVNKARLAMVAAGRPIESILPTVAALIQHVKRAVLQSIIWKFNKEPHYPSPHQWGWSQDAA